MSFIKVTTMPGVNNSPNTNWNGVASSADGVKLVAVVSGGNIWTSIDSGATWTSRASVQYWYGVASSADGVKLVAVDGGNIWTSTDSGVTWTSRASGQGWYKVASSADGVKLVAAVNAGNIWTSTDSGVTWTSRATALANWMGVASSTDGVKLVAVVLNGNIWTSADSGVTWTSRATVAKWEGVASDSTGTKLVAVAYTGNIWTSIDSGLTWTSRATVLGWVDVASSADGVKLVAVEIGTLSIWTSTDSGLTWTQRATSLVWYSVASSADGVKLVAAVAFSAVPGKVWTSIDSGLTWALPTAPQNWRGVASDSTGVKLVAVAYNGTIATSTNTGATWTSRATVDNWRGVASDSTGTKLVAVVWNGNIWTSADSGVTWTSRAAARAWLSVASSTDGTKLVAVVYGGNIWTSADSGVTWTSRASSLIWASVACNSTGTIIYASGGNSLYKSTDSGVTWLPLTNIVTVNGLSDTTLGFGTCNALACNAAGTTVYAGLIAGSISMGLSSFYISLDSGASWISKEALAIKASWSGVAASSDGTKITIISDRVDNPYATTGYAYYSKDSGALWLREATSGSRQWKSIATDSTGLKSILAAGVDGVFLSYTTEVIPGVPAGANSGLTKTKGDTTNTIVAGDVNASIPRTLITLYINGTISLKDATTGLVLASVVTPAGALPTDLITVRKDDGILTVLYNGKVLFTYLIPVATYPGLVGSTGWLGWGNYTTFALLPSQLPLPTIAPLTGYQYSLNKKDLTGPLGTDIDMWRWAQYWAGETLLFFADNSFYASIEPVDSDISLATKAYLGGRSYIVGTADANQIAQAGYGAYLTAL